MDDWDEGGMMMRVRRRGLFWLKSVVVVGGRSLTRMFTGDLRNKILLLYDEVLLLLVGQVRQN